MSDERACPACGRTAGPDDRFCSGCGTRLGDKVALRGPTRASLDEMFAHLRSGEQRPATILMTDVSGFSSMGESAEPEWLFHLMNQIFEELVECLVAHGAHIDKFVGDEVVALFGVPVAQERSAERAVLAALAMRERLRVLNQQGQFGDVELEIHTGINVGRVMVGPVGHSAHAEYTVIGDAVNVTKRLEDEAPAGEIYVSDAVRDAVGDAVELEHVGPLSLTKRRQPVDAFRVVEARGAEGVEMDQAAEGAGVGAAREAELRELTHHCEEAAGVQRCVCVVGPPGIGKSHLIGNWSGSGAALDYRVVATECHTCGQYFPSLSVADLVARLVGLRLEGWPPRVTGDVDAALGATAVGEEARTQLAAFLRSIDQPAEDGDDWPGALCDGLTSLLREATKSGTVCLVVEDVQWIDEASRAVLADVLSRQMEWPLAVVFSARDPVPEWLTDDLNVARVRLGPLPRATIERLVRGWMAPRLLPASAVRAICDRAEGHPYFARELVRSLTQSAAGSSAENAGLPETLGELFLAQLDELPLGLRRLVQGAAVLGEPLSPDLLAAALADDAGLTSTLLREATQRGLLRAAPVPGQFVFERRLLFEAAYTTIPPMRRQDLHGRIADHLIAELETTGGLIHASAHHAYLGYRDERAVNLLIRSARQYRAQYANRQAIQTASRATELIASLQKPHQFLSQRLEALLFLAQSYQVVGDIGQAQGAIAEAGILAEDCEDQELVGQIATSAATLCWMQGDIGEAEQRFSRALEAWESLDNDTRAAQALVGMGLCARQSGRRPEALGLFLQAATREGADPWAKAAALNNAGILLLADGRYMEAKPYLWDGLRANEEDDDRRGIAHSKASIGELHYRLGELAEAKRWLQEAIEDAGDIEDAQCLSVANIVLSRTYALEGDLRAARGALRGVGAQDCSGDAETAMLRRVAELELGLAAEMAGQRPALRAMIGAAAEGIESEDETDGQSWSNAHLELVCAELEAALVVRNHGAANARVAAVAQLVPTVPDRHLRRYAQWLVTLSSVREGAPAPRMEPAGEEPTAFQMRSARLLEALTGPR